MKGLPKFAVSKPVTTMMFYLGVLLLGMICVKRLPQELFPPITYPVLSVVTNYPNAAPEEIESLVTKLIEEAIGTAKGIKRISSQSREGVSIITVEFNWGTNMDFAALGLREKIDLVKEQLPRDSEEPLVLKFNPYEKPIMVFSVTGSWPQQDLLRYAKKVMKDKLEKLEGVASASISGGLVRQILVEVDRGQLAATKIDILSVSDAIANSNLNYPAGTTKEKFYEYLIRTIGEYEDVNEIRNTVVSLDLIKEQEEEEKKRRREEGEDKRRAMKTPTKYKPVIILTDVADVTDTFKEKTSHSRYNGKENISIAIQKQADANTIQTAKRILKEMAVIEKALPEGIDVEIVYNAAVFIKNSIMSVANAAWQGGVLAFFVLLFFLKDTRKSVVVATTIPLCLLTTLICMYFMGISLNMLSMGGLAMGIGMLVDAGIVVVENISRHLSLGAKARESSIDGATEVSSAVFSSTLTSVAVFLPMVFIIGIAGQLFRELALTVTFILLASYFVAITWIPRLTMKSKPEKAKKSKFFQGADMMLQFINKYYSRILEWFLVNRLKGMVAVAIIFVISMFSFKLIEKEVLPKVDQGQVTINLTMLTGTRLEITNKYVRLIEDLILAEPDVLNVNVSVGSSREGGGSGAVETLGSHQGRILVNLKKKRSQTSPEFIASLREKVNKLGIPATADVEYIATESEFVGVGGGGADAAVEVKGNEFPVLLDLTKQLEEKIREIPEVIYVKNSLAQPSPEAKIHVNKDKAALYNLSVKDISETALLCIRGLVASKFKEEGNEYDILIRLKERDRQSVTDLRDIFIHSSQLNQPVPIDELAYLTFGKGPSRIDRKEQQRIITVSVNKEKDASLKELNEKIKAIIDDIKVPSNYTVKLGGEEEEVQESFRSVIFAIVLSIILIYMIMASQFESLLQPFIIMFTVPLSLIGVALTLILTGTALSVMALLGVIILGGLIVNNGIVLIQYMNDLRAEGVELRESVVRASKIRLRPILMTAFTTVFGLIPLSLGLGEGAQLQAPMARVIMGGIITSTFLTLVVIPVLYLSSERAKSRMRARKIDIRDLVGKM